MFPVVQAGAPNLLFIERESERLDEVQRGAGGQATAAGVTGIPMNFRMDEDDVNHRGISSSENGIHRGWYWRSIRAT